MRVEGGVPEGVLREYCSDFGPFQEQHSRARQASEVRGSNVASV